MKRFLLIVIYAIVTLSCSKSKDDPVVLNADKQILSFLVEKAISTELNQETKKIQILVPNTTDLAKISPQITVSPKSKVNPASGVTQDFTYKAVSYTVTAEDGSQNIYEVSIKSIGSDQKDILAIELPNLYQQGVITENNITFHLPFGTKTNQLKVKATLSAGASIAPALDVAIDLQNNPSLTVTAQDGTTKTYTVSFTYGEQETAIRAVWIPDPSHTNSMRTYQNVLNTVQLLDDLNFNAIYVATWVRTQTAYPSQVLLNNTSYTDIAETNLFNQYLPGAYNYPVASPTGDPLKDLITEAHKKGIKVIFWFEYGFMAAAGQDPTPNNNKLLAKHPDWIGKANDGGTSNYNKTDYYLNGYKPEVQNLMLDLIKESMLRYPEVDGIQGDDRMPAMPRNSGYDVYTKERYKTEKGNYPPTDPNNADWVRWRLDILNSFGKTLYTHIKTINPKAIVCFSPNPYPWSEQNLMQEWPQWIKSGIVEILSVQCYRNTADAYRATVQQAKEYVMSNTTKSILNPGMILKSGSTIMSESLLIDQLNINRSLGTNGEAYFFIDGLQDATVQKVLKAKYAGKALFPKL